MSIFDIFNRNLQSASKRKSKAEKGDNVSDLARDTAMSNAAMNSAQKSTKAADIKYTKSASYDRKLYDDGAAKRNAKTDAFSKGDVYDPYTGKQLELTVKEAKAKYGNAWQEHLAESDHIKPLQKIHDETVNNAWNTQEDIRSAANSKDNISVTSRKFNNAKRSKTNTEYVQDKKYLDEKSIELTEAGRKNALTDEKNAERSIKRQLKTSAAKNIIETGHQAGVESAKAGGNMALAVSGISNIVSVISGEKTSAEAIADTAKDTGKAIVTSYAAGNITTTITHTLSSSKSEFIQGLAKAGVPGKIITGITLMGKTVTRFLSGDIDFDECIVELGETGTAVAATSYTMAVGQALIPIPVIGAAVGAFVGAALSKGIFASISNEIQQTKERSMRAKQLIAEYEQVKEAAMQYQKQLQEYFNQYFDDWSECFGGALSMIERSLEIGDANGIIAGANQITQKLGGTVNYNNVDEFKVFLNDSSTDIL